MQSLLSHASSFSLDLCQGKSVAAANLANWAINCVKYHKIYVKVAPLMAKVKEATDTKNTAEASLAIVLQKAGGGGPGERGGVASDGASPVLVTTAGQLPGPWSGCRHRGRVSEAGGEAEWCSVRDTWARFASVFSMWSLKSRMQHVLQCSSTSPCS